MKKVIRLTESDLTRLVKRVVRESEMNEDFGGFPGTCIINIEGEGDVKKHAISEIKKALRNIGGKIRLKVDGEEVSLHGNPKGGWM